MPRWQAWLLRRTANAHWLVVAVWGLFALGAMAGPWRPTGGQVFGLAVLTLLAVVALLAWSLWRRERAIREAPLPHFLKRKLREAYPQLSGKDADLVERGLRQFFLACLRSKKRFVAMPSRAVDAMWHEFILHTQAYQAWCELTLGWFLHHTPAQALGGRAGSNDGLRRAWYWACRDEAISPRAPSRLPLLFALDAKLEIANGFRYQADCRDIRRKSEQGGDGSGTYCGTDFSDGGYGGDAGGFGGETSSSDGSSGADAGGDGGGGCGGGGGD